MSARTVYTVNSNNKNNAKCLRYVYVKVNGSLQNMHCNDNILILKASEYHTQLQSIEPGDNYPFMGFSIL